MHELFVVVILALAIAGFGRAKLLAPIRFVGHLFSRPILHLLLFLVCVAAVVGAPAELAIQTAKDDQKTTPPQWLVVTAPAFRVSLAPLIEKRRAEGRQVTVVETTNVLTRNQIQQGDGGALATWINRRLGQTAGARDVLLVGAVRANDPLTAEQTVVPGIPGAVGRMEGKTSDYAYSLPGEDGMPRIAVGRFPGRTVEEVQSMVHKTLRLEQDWQPGPWRSQITLLQGNPGGGPLAEMFVEQAASARLQRLHPGWRLQAISHSGASIYYLPTCRLQEMVPRFLQAGQLFCIYMGHSDASGLWSNGAYLMKRQDWANLDIKQCQGVFFTCGCYACEWDGGKGEGYGLAAMRNPGGPAAVIGACAESYSAPGLLAIDGLLGCCVAPPFPVRLADYWLAVQAGLAKGPIDEGAFSLYDRFDGSGGKVPLSVQRREHLEMWTLLGDPALRLPVVPMDIRLEPASPATAGKQLKVQGILPDRLKGAIVHVSIERPPGSKPDHMEKLPDTSPEHASAREQTATENHRKANDVVMASVDAKSTQTRFECSLDLPSALAWPKLVVRAYAANANAEALGVAILTVAQ